NEWFERKSQNGTKAWIYSGAGATPEALCIYDIQQDQQITDDRQILHGRALKLCTFKVGESVRGRKIGELFLKAAFRYASDNQIENIFITTKPEEHQYLTDLLIDFVFVEKGNHHGDTVYVKHHPIVPPNDAQLSPFKYHRLYFPHYRSDTSIQKFII